jgi:hypothetical protein
LQDTASPSDRIANIPFSKRKDSNEGNRFFSGKQFLFWETTADGLAARTQEAGSAPGEP